MGATRPDGYPVIILSSKDYLARLTARLQNRLPIWVIYRPPTIEYGPGIWVTRMHITLPRTRPTRFVMTHDSLEELREMLPPWLSRIGRDPRDPPSIVESWI
jgi:hypothetical protein